VDSSTETTDVMKHILRYLLDHPTARDTAAGIQLWWLERRYVLASVEQGVETLVEKGWLQSHALASGARIFGLSEGSASDARAFVDQGDTPWPI
jgi:hypothetical protein